MTVGEEVLLCQGALHHRIAGPADDNVAPAPVAANDSGAGGPASAGRDTRFVSGAAASAAPHAAPSQSRARGIGSRFRAPARPMEKFK